MTARTERGGFAYGREAAKAYAGSALSLLGVASSLVRAQTVGPENDDGHLQGVYPLTPLHWVVSSTGRRHLPADVLAVHSGTVPAGTRIRAYAPKDLPNAGFNAVSLQLLARPDDGEDAGGVAAVFRTFGDDHLLVARIPTRHIVAAIADHSDRFEWMSRFGTRGEFGAGRLHPNGAIFATAASAIASMSTEDVQSGMPAY